MEAKTNNRDWKELIDGMIKDFMSRDCRPPLFLTLGAVHYKEVVEQVGSDTYRGVKIKSSGRTNESK